jgi:hypothetical protein
MNGVIVTIKNYLSQKNPQPHLAISNPDLTSDEMMNLGFRPDGEYWVISKKDAQGALGLGGIDYNKHWRAEKKARRDMIRELQSR